MNTLSEAGYLARGQRKAASRSFRDGWGIVVAVGAMVLVCVSKVQADPDLKEAKRLLREGQPAKATEVLRQIMTQKPDDPWLLYDIGVTAYAAKDYQKADEIWQELAARQLPSGLRDKVWFQIGNVSYRFGEQNEAAVPEEAVAKWEQSLESYKIVLAAHPRDKETKYNQIVVERKLARLHAQMARQLIQESQKQNRDTQIEKLEAALDHQHAAERLEPENQQYQQDARQTEKQLSQKFTEKAKEEEKSADRTVENKQASTWERKHAEEQLEKALADFQEAKQLDAQNQEAAEGEQRVQEKLSKLLTQEARQLQKDAQQEKSWNPDDAINKFEQALDKFEQAINRNEKNQEAKKGEQEVKKELEELQMKRGDQMAEEGRRDAPHQPAKAAEEMMDAISHYQQAEQINPDNPDAPPKIAALEKILPPLLDALAQRERQDAAKAEPKSPENAVAHLERAETAYEMMQEVQPNNQQAQQGEEQVRKDIARLRQQLAQKAQQQQQQEQQAKSEEEQDKEQKNFQNMLARVKRDDRQQQYEADRRNPTQKYNPEANRIHKNW